MGRFTQYDFVAYEKLTTSLRHRKLVVGLIYKKQFMSCKFVASDKVVPCRTV